MIDFKVESLGTRFCPLMTQADAKTGVILNVHCTREKCALWVSDLGGLSLEGCAIKIGALSK